METDYDTRVDTWLRAHGITVEITKLRTGPVRWDSNNLHDIYRAEFHRDDRKPLVIDEFGQSIIHSSPPVECIRGCPVQFGESSRHSDLCWNNPRNNRVQAPSAYDVLAGVQKSDLGSFSEFCADFGYDTDSISAKETWKACWEEFASVQRFFSEAELAELQEIAS